MHDALKAPHRPVPSFRVAIPFWATREFKLLLIVVILTLSAVGVVVFEILPNQQTLLAHKRAASNTIGAVPRTPSNVSAPVRPTQVLFDGVLDHARDSTPINQAEIPYQYLIDYLSHATPGELAKQARTVPYADYSRRPAALRGQVIKVNALLADLFPLRLEPKQGAIEWIYRTILVDLSGEEGYIVDLLDRPPEIPRRSLVTVEGVFLKVATYEGTQGTVHAPLLLGRRIRPLKEKAAADPGDLGTLLVVFSVASLLFVLFLTVRIFKQARPQRVPGFLFPKGR